jgi:mannonate dehydratase
MDRRHFLSATGLAAAAIAGPAGAMAQAAKSAPARPSPARSAGKPKLGCQSGPSTDEHFAYFARYGVKNISASVPIADPNRLYPTVDELRKVQDMAGKYGITVDMVDSILLQSSHIDREKNPAIMLAQSPQRDRDIEAFQTLVRNCATVGISTVKYNMSILGVLRSGRTPGRGDAQYNTWNLAQAKPETPLTKAGVVDAARFWERIHYFLDRVIPVATENKVRIACHPQDPGVPPAGYQGIDRVLGTIDGLKQFVAYKENPYHGLNFCQGTVSEDLRDPATEIFDVIRYFGSRKKIFNVHFRNIKGHRDSFQETFPDDGDVDFVKAIKVYREVGYDGMLMPDHVPTVPGHPEAGLQNFAFAYGYIRALIQATET